MPMWSRKSFHILFFISVLFFIIVSLLCQIFPRPLLKTILRISLTCKDQYIPISAAVRTKMSHKTLEHVRLAPASVMYWKEKLILKVSWWGRDNLVLFSLTWRPWIELAWVNFWRVFKNEACSETRGKWYWDFWSEISGFLYTSEDFSSLVSFGCNVRTCKGVYQ